MTKFLDFILAVFLIELVVFIGYLLYWFTKDLINGDKK